MTTPILTADLYASAIVAAARANGDDPIAACTCPPNALARRALTAAVSAICRELDLDLRRVGYVLKVKRATVYTCRTKAPASFVRAEAAAREAIRAHAPSPAPPRLRLRPVQSVARPAIEALAPPAPPSPQRLATVRLLNTEQRPVVGAAPAKPLAPAVLPDAPGSLRARILAVLKDAPSTAPSLAILTDAKELAVTEALQCLLREGAVEAGPIPPHGARHREWRLVNDGEGA